MYVQMQLVKPTLLCSADCIHKKEKEKVFEG